MIRIADLRETTIDLAFSKLVIAEGFVSYIAAPLVVKGAIAIESTSLYASLQASNHDLHIRCLPQSRI
jgi:hypothetical protein